MPLPMPPMGTPDSGIPVADPCAFMPAATIAALLIFPSDPFRVVERVMYHIKNSWSRSNLGLGSVQKQVMMMETSARKFAHR